MKEKITIDLIGERPMMIGCSGGGGHIAAIKGIADCLSNSKINLTNYVPKPYNKELTTTKAQIIFAAGFMATPVIGKTTEKIMTHTPIPVLPDLKSLRKEIRSLSPKEPIQNRPYIDMLLDVYPAGYESAAIWNVLQRNDKISELVKLIKLQHLSDKNNHKVVYDHFLNVLKNSAEDGQAYSEIISTQAMALPALCDAVIEYNEWVQHNQLANARQIKIHQYMTDLPTKGAVHFFNPLSKLSPQQQKQMRLYGVGLEDGILNHFFQNNHFFDGIINLPPKKNPMVRAGFTQPELDNSTKFHEPVSLSLLSETTPVNIESDEQIASIMLGSQAGKDTVEYIETLLQNGMNRVFVFGGKNEMILSKINKIISAHPEYKERIIPLANQEDQQIAALMTRSNMVIIRGGGLSVMEQLCMNHSPEQMVFIHHANSNKVNLTSGISWEDANVNRLISKLRAQGVHTEKTSPQRAVWQIPIARLKVNLEKTNVEKERLNRKLEIGPKRMSPIIKEEVTVELSNQERARISLKRLGIDHAALSDEQESAILAISKGLSIAQDKELDQLFTFISSNSGNAIKFAQIVDRTDRVIQFLKNVTNDNRSTKATSIYEHAKHFNTTIILKCYDYLQKENPTKQESVTFCKEIDAALRQFADNALSIDRGVMRKAMNIIVNVILHATGLFLIFNTLNKAITGNYLFFNQTRSEVEVEKVVNQVKQLASPKKKTNANTERISRPSDEPAAEQHLT